MDLFIVGFIVFAIGSYFDIDYSELARRVGADEENPIVRDHAHKFLAQRDLLLTIAFALISLFVYTYFYRSWEIGATLLILGIVRAIVGLAVDRPIYIKFKDQINSPK